MAVSNDSGRLYFTAGIDNSQLKKDAEQAKEQLRGVGKSAEDEGSRIDAAFKKIGKSIAAIFTVQQATSFVKEIVKVRGEVENLEKSFSILAGKEYGQQLFEDIRAFTLNTPMMMKDLASGAQTLLSFNIAAEEVMPILRSLGDISMGDAQKFQSLTLAFAQMSSTGKLMGQDLLQMINAGFNPLSVISEQTGKSIGELKDEMSKSAISAEMVKQAFMDATSEGGKFYGMLETQSKGIAGQMSNLQGAIEDMFNQIGKDSEGVITGAIQAATDLVKSYEEVGRVVAELIATYGVYKAALMTITALQATAASIQAGWTAAELAHYNALLLVEKAQALLNATILKNPYVLAAAAVAALAYGMYKLITRQTEAEKAQARLNETTKKFDTEVAQEKARIDDLFARLKAARKETGEYEKAKKAIINQYGEYLEGLSDEVKSLGDVEAAYKAVTKAAREAALERARASATKDAEEAFAKNTVKAWDKIRTELKKRYKDQTDENGMSLATKYYNELVYGDDKEQQEKILKEFDVTRFIPSTTPGIQSSTYTTNVLKGYMNELKEEQERLDETRKEIDVLFGTSPTQQQTGGGDDGGAEEEKEAKKNYKYWKDIKEKKEAELKQIESANMDSQEAKAIIKEIKEADKYLAAYNVSSTSSKSGSSAKQQAKKYQQRAAQIKKYGQEVAEEMRQSEFNIRQAGIDAMEDGVDKELEQVRLNYDRLIAENAKREAEWVEKLREAEKLRWQQEHGGSTEGFDESAITSENLTDEQQNALKEYTRIANEYQVNANKKAIAKMLDEFLTYEQQRTKISEEYARKREALYTTDEGGNKTLREGVTEGNVSELDRSEDEALAAIDEQFAQREETYQVWCEEIAAMSLEELRTALEEAQAQLEEIQQNGSGDSQQVATARAQVNTAQKALNKQEAKTDTAPSKRSIKEWEDLYKTLNECCDAFKSLGEEVDGTVGEIITTLGGVSTSVLSMINGIVQFGQIGTQTVGATATAIKTVEKASVILTVIAAAMEVAMAIVNLFNNDESYQKEIEKLQRRIDQLQWELDNMDAVRLQQEAGDAVENVRQKIYEAKTELYGYYGEITNWYDKMRWANRKASKDADLMSKSVEKLVEYYGNMSYTADKALGTNSWKEAKEQLENISQQMVLVNEQLEDEQAKKKTDKDQVQEYEQTLNELAEQAEDLINSMVEDIMGGSASDLAEKLGDALIEAFEAGEDAAEKWGETVNDIVKDILKNLIVTELIEEPIGELFNKYKEKWFPNGDFSDVSVLNESINDFAAEMNDLYYGVVDSAQAIWDALDEQLGLTDTDRTASESGIATASQESVDELNGRATAIQSHTYSINEQTKTLVTNSNNILESVINIEMYTQLIAEGMGVLQTDMGDMRDSMDEVLLRGLKIK